MKDQGMAVIRMWPWCGEWFGGDDAVEYSPSFLRKLHKRVESQTVGSIYALEPSDEVVHYEELFSLEETSVLVL